ncbi:HpcH/HpaI aldolase/citrate lyase family protein [Caballeronia sp. 15711]|uniref:HpcH/HpaI aldolase/citrate lyase family protein n=1 Tax=Caballeronia sp. 15711 TaxID=3391029 RepID=UPI0039E64656
MNHSCYSRPRLNRSSLIVPLSNRKFIEKAHLRGADSITLDLEDGVASNAKADARAALADAIPMVSRGGAWIKVRVNRRLDLLVEDLRAAVIEGVACIGIAKTDSAGHVRLVAELIGELERERGLPIGAIRLAASIETPQALQRAHEIATADMRLMSIGLGSLDLAAACGFEAVPETLLYPKQMVFYAAKAAGLECGGFIGSIADYTDLDGMREVIRESKKFGFRGGGAIHPNQVKVLNEEYGPSREQIDNARTIIDLAEAAFAEGKGAFAYKGKMVDKPVIDAARETLTLAATIAEHEAKVQQLLINEH